MNIYKELPGNWKDLQIMVSKILSEIGYTCEIEKNIQTTRETVNVDVFAINVKENPNTCIICECKYWNKSIPKTVIHLFRTIITDYGANHGILISKKGFQSGSYDAKKNTNIELLNWIEFQEYFKIKWVKSKILKTSLETRSLYNYVSVGFIIFFKKEYQELNSDDLQKFNSLQNEYFNYAFYSSNLDCKNLETQEFDFDIFEMYLKQAEKDFDQNFNSFDEYFTYLIDRCNEGTKIFDDLFKQKLRKDESNLINKI